MAGKDGDLPVLKVHVALNNSWFILFNISVLLVLAVIGFIWFFGVMIERGNSVFHWFFLPSYIVQYFGFSLFSTQDVLFISLIFYLSITLISAFLIFLRYQKLHPIEYLPCPYTEDCDMSIRIYERWRCDYCHHTQTKPSYIVKPCERCNRTLKKVTCEHCGKEVRI